MVRADRPDLHLQRAAYRAEDRLLYLYLHLPQRAWLSAADWTRTDSQRAPAASAMRVAEQLARNASRSDGL